MALREVLAELDVKVKGKEDVSQTNQAIDAFVRSVDNAKTPAQTYSRNVTRMRQGLAGAGGEGGAPSVAAAAGTSAIAIAGWTEVVRRVADAVVDVARTLAEWTAEIIRLGDELDDASRRTGVSAETLQEWSFAADRLGVETGDLNAGMRAFNRTLGQAANGQNTAGAAFRRLHVDIRDGNGQLRARGAVMRDAIRALQQIQNPTERAARAQQVFGRGAEGMGALLNATGEDLDRAIERFHELGGGLSNDVVAQAGAADDALKDFRLVMLNLRSAIVTAILPAFTRLVTTIAPYIGALANAIKNSSALQLVLGGLAVVIGIVAAGIAIMLIPVALLVASLGAMFLIAEDVFTAFRGGDSVTSRLINRWLEAHDVAWQFADILKDIPILWHEVSAAGQTAVANIVDDIVTLVGLTGQVPEALASAAMRLRAGATTATVIAAGEHSDLRRQVAARGLVRSGQETLHAAQMAATNNINVTVQGGGDPNIAAQRTAREVDRTLRQRHAEAARALLPQAAR